MTLTFETSLPVQPGPAPDDFVLPKKYTKGKANRGPRLGDDVWDLRPFLPRTTRRGRVNFLVFDEGLQRRTAQQYAFAVLRETPGNQRWPVKPTTLPQEIHTLRRVWANLRTVGIERLQDVRREHLEALLPLMRRSGPNMVEDQVTTLKRLAEFGPLLSFSGLRIGSRTDLIAAIRRLRWPWPALDGWGLGQSEELFDCGRSRWLGTVQGIMRV